MPRRDLGTFRSLLALGSLIFGVPMVVGPCLAVSDRSRTVGLGEAVGLLVGVAIGFALLFAAVVLVCEDYRLRRRATAGDRRVCYRCGYDMRETTGSRCPECNATREKSGAERAADRDAAAADLLSMTDPSEPADAIRS